MSIPITTYDVPRPSVHCERPRAVRGHLTDSDGGMIPLLIFGARSYTAGELLRLLAGHGAIHPAFLVSRSLTGGDVTVDALQPHVAGFFADAMVGTDDQAYEWLAGRPDAAIALCTGSHESAPIVAELAKRGLLTGRALVDLSGDFRLPSDAEYREWYGKPHACPEMLSRFDYCIPELHRRTSKSKLVSNPGCFATAVQLALCAGIGTGVVSQQAHVFAVTGSSGSGATPKPNTHHPFRAHEFYAYKPLTHQHTPEIILGVNRARSSKSAEIRIDDLSLVTHSAPLVRGISVTASFRIRDDLCRGADNAVSQSLAEDFVGSVRGFATAEPMLRWSDSPPGLAGVIGTNLARLGASVEGGRAVVFCTIDNLCRGASGQALQNLNRVLGLDETLGLTLPGLNPM